MNKIKTIWINSYIYRVINVMMNNFYRNKLKNSDFTILCSNCVGGCIYHRLGKEFLSPTINLYFEQPDFVQFLLHLDYYCDEELLFIESDRSYPVATLGGGKFRQIFLYFVHYKSEAEARNKWNERKNRINKNNLYIIMYNIQGITEKELHMLDNYPCQNKVLLNWKEMPEISWSVHVDPGKKNDYLAKNIWGKRQYERQWDFVGFLNTRRDAYEAR